jgi:hypothetical protein
LLAPVNLWLSTIFLALATIAVDPAT